MKVRQGFVSNSSSSSFVVRTKNDSWGRFKEDLIATDEEILKCIDYGFKLSLRLRHASDIEAGVPMHPTKHLKKAMIAYHSVICNEDEPMEFLVRNGIPFEASCHYGHEYVTFRRGSKHVYTVSNHGLSCEMYGIEELGKIKDNDWFSKTPVSGFKYGGNGS